MPKGAKSARSNWHRGRRTGLTAHFTLSLRWSGWWWILFAAAAGKANLRVDEA